MHTWPSLGRFEQDIVGESHYQPQLHAIAAQLASTGAQSFTVHLVPEATNPHDAHAVAVHHQGTCIGYLSRDDARSFRRRLGAKRLTGQTTRCQATLLGGHQRRDESRALLGVALDIKPFD